MQNYLIRSNIKGGVMGLGVFDGYHLGHQELLKHCDHALSFFPHPDYVLKKNKNIQYLTTIDELFTFFPKVSVLQFDEDMSKKLPTAFMEDVIMSTFSPKKLVVGYDFKFGYQAQGSVFWLKEWGLKRHVEIQVIPAVLDEKGFPIKSHQIRQYLSTKELFYSALKDLGHPYLVKGEVIHGEGRGKTLGYPTANLRIPIEKQWPAFGVYKGKVFVENKKYVGMVYIGKKPTFNGHQLVFEVHLLGFNNNLYGHVLSVYLTDFIRGEKAFSNQEELKAQIQKDIESIG